MYLYNLDTDDLICKSCPVYGTQPGESALRHICLRVLVCPEDVVMPRLIKGLYASVPLVQTPWHARLVGARVGESLP